MKASLSPANLQEWTGSVLVVGFLEEDFEKQLTQLEKRWGASISKAITSQGFKATVDLES